eukprot:1323822-Amphidinium_carterae.1
MRASHLRRREDADSGSKRVSRSKCRYIQEAKRTAPASENRACCCRTTLLVLGLRMCRKASVIE